MRFLTAGSVDDGKSTIIGRLLHESGGIFEDELASMVRSSSMNGNGFDPSLATDGLRAEREQGITIELAALGCPIKSTTLTVFVTVTQNMTKK